MIDTYIFEYFLFTLLASFGILQVSLGKKFSGRFFIGIFIILASYVWFFSSRNRNVQTAVEGLQLSLIFAFSAIFAVLITRIISLLIKKI